MAARRSWIVLVDNADQLSQCESYSGRYQPYKDNFITSIFFREAHAESFAKSIASKYPGKDIHVFKQSHGYTAQPQPVQSKIWTEDGQFIPAK